MIPAATKPRHRYSPDYAIPPGETLRETLDALQMAQADLARRTGLSIKHINQIVQGAAPITPDTALALGRATGVPAGFWARLDANYQAREAVRRERLTLDPNLSWLDRLPINDLVRRGYLERNADDISRLQEVLDFFGVASAKAWLEVWMAPDAAFRKSPAFRSDPYAVACWLRMGEIQAATINCEPFNRERFTTSLWAIRSLMGADPRVFEPALRRLCRESGVAVVIVEETEGSRMSGAARWLSPTKALLQLSLRYRWADHFWFSFFHEAGHLLLHGKRDAFVDEGRASEDDKEAQANAFAQGMLIPAEHEPRLAQLRTLDDIRVFAASIGVPAGVVVGRLQHTEMLGHRVGNGLRQKYTWREPS